MILDRYIFRLWATPFFAGISLVMVVLLFSRTLRLLDQANDVAGLWGVIGQLVILTIPYFAMLAVPIAFFLAMQQVVIGLQERSEMDAFRAAGVSYPRILRSIFWVALLLWLGLLMDSLVLLPKAQVEFANVLDEAYAQKGGIGLTPQRFSDDLEDVQFYVDGQVGKNLYKGILIEDRRSTIPVFYLARQAHVVSRNHELSITLTEGYRLEGEGESERILGFRKYHVAIPLPRGGFQLLTGTEHESLMTGGLLLKLAREGNRKASAELSRRLILASIIWMLFLLALPLSISGKRSGRSGRVVLGILSLIVIYNFELVILRYASHGLISIGTLWGANVAILIGLAWLWVAASRDRMPAVIVTIEDWTSSISGLMARLLRKRYG